MGEVERLAADIGKHYLESGDFNGFPVRSIAGAIDECRGLVRGLIEGGLAVVNFGDRHPNPHILAFRPESVEDQLRKLKTSAVEDACIYPSAKYLASVVDVEAYAGRPFEERLALGAAQLELAAFDLGVLERYRNDPRYVYRTDDVQGMICSSNEGEARPWTLGGADDILLENFGFGFDRDIRERVVMVFLRYLADLTAEHQQIWKAQELGGEYVPHSGFWASAMGDWSDHVSIFVAFCEEVKYINMLCEQVKRPKLFRRIFERETRPREFGFLIRPTLGEFNRFVQTLDKMLSDNIDKAFFLGEIAEESQEKRSDGSVVVRLKGTIQLLEDWLRVNFRAEEGDPVEEISGALRKVRKLRQRPAHVVEEDVFDQEYLRKQREVMGEAYGAVRTLRQILECHPDTHVEGMPVWLKEGKIWTY